MKILSRVQGHVVRRVARRLEDHGLLVPELDRFPFGERAGELLRLKRLNEEFDPLLKVRDDAEAQAHQVLKADLANPKAVVLAAEGVGADRDKVVGFVRALVRERPFYAPEHEGVILDIYLLPLYRRRGVGEYVLRETSNALKAKGAGIVTAEFPAQNEIANRCYSKRGFRPITVVPARSL